MEVTTKLSVKLMVGILSIICWATTVFAATDVTIQHLATMKFSSEAQLPTQARDFAVTEDGVILIPDYVDGNVKLYEENGKVLKFIGKIGTKGMEKGQLSEPFFCFYDKAQGKFGVFDFGRRRIIVYDRESRTMFTPTKELYCLSLGRGIRISGSGDIVISGYTTDSGKNPHDLYSVRLADEEKSFLMPSYLKYGLNSFQEYKSEYRDKLDLRTIGTAGWFDVQGDTIYYIWEGDLRIIKLNITGKSEPVFFGHKTVHYVKPHASGKMLEKKRNQDFKSLHDEKKKMSYIRGIFATNDHVFVTYQRSVSLKPHYRLQAYTVDGQFLKDVPIPGKPDFKMWLDKERYILYSFTNKSGQDFSISKFKIVID